MGQGFNLGWIHIGGSEFDIVMRFRFPGDPVTYSGREGGIVLVDRGAAQSQVV